MEEFSYTRNAQMAEYCNIHVRKLILGLTMASGGSRPGTSTTRNIYVLPSSSLAYDFQIMAPIA